MGLIFLIGFMGSGKSTVSGYLQQYSDYTKIEMDEEIEEKEHMKIREIFKGKGEEYFRNLETEYLLQISKTDENYVVSCGGGVAMKEENVRIMKSCGRVVWLDALPGTIYERVKDSHHRPLLEGHWNVSYIQGLMDKRRNQYESAADICIQTDYQTPEEICKKLLEEITQE
ncbi:MAG: shikimate kinase [Blautia sp.]|nr:shikimate kinase [Blautia sp.]